MHVIWGYFYNNTKDFTITSICCHLLNIFTYFKKQTDKTIMESEVEKKYFATHI